MNLSDLKPKVGSKHRRKIVGRGRGSGHGGSATRGMKGQNSRSGGGTRPGFEGGQMPLMRRLPKRGFTNIFKKGYEIINIGLLEKVFNHRDTENTEKTSAPSAVNAFEKIEINKKVLVEKGLIDGKLPLKILGDGEIKKPLKITADKFSKSAVEKIKKAGGEVITAIKSSKLKMKN
ncbi:MAG: 50S ribosomal protein L15 [Elusimicrobia bacterium CG06_land_8_20_14_3_00_38_11]|nr:MAG: 50S ribosomal protein L15 [Elusimicrobia bacterium CG06_land_8_20_14_3_00_38_11]